MKKTILYFICFSMLALSSLQAQGTVVLSTEDIIATPGEMVSIDVKVENWENVVSAQWTMHWNDAVLQFESISSFALPAASIEENFGMPPITDDNTLTFSWYDASVTGFSINDNDILFKVNFQVIGSNGDATDFFFDGIPTAIEVMNIENVILDLNINSGELMVEGSNAVETIHTSDFALYANTPNPFQDFTNIVFDLHKRSLTRLSIYNTTGQLLLEKEYDLGIGSHTIPVSKAIFPSAGTYLYRISTEEATATRKMTLVY